MKPYYNTPEGQIYQGNALGVLKEMPSESAQMCVTSPPYWGLRDYGIDGQIGLEKTPEEYIEKMVQIFRELKRVLRDDGTLWLNMGDSYAGSGSPGGDFRDGKGGDEYLRPYNRKGDGLKPKDLCGIPWMLAFALRADGWYLRSDIIWHKPNPMPEPVTDRPTKAHEHLFLLTKSAKYYYDAEAIKEPAAYDGRKDTLMKGRQHGGDTKYTDAKYMPQNQQSVHDRGHERWPSRLENGQRARNKRSVWSVATKPFSGAHFAVFPEKLIEPCILAGTSEKGCCVECGSPWVRITEKGLTGNRERDGINRGIDSRGERIRAGDSDSKTTGWKSNCRCHHNKLREDTPAHIKTKNLIEWFEKVTPQSKPCVVLDPFFGSGTTGIVAHKHGRKFIGIELSQSYVDEIAIPRIRKATKQLKLW